MKKMISVVAAAAVFCGIGMTSASAAPVVPAPTRAVHSVTNPTNPWEWFLHGLGCYKVKAPYCYSSGKAVRGR